MEAGVRKCRTLLPKLFCGVPLQPLRTKKCSRTIMQSYKWSRYSQISESTGPNRKYTRLDTSINDSTATVCPVPAKPYTFTFNSRTVSAPTSQRKCSWYKSHPARGMIRWNRYLISSFNVISDLILAKRSNPHVIYIRKVIEASGSTHQQPARSPQPR